MYSHTTQTNPQTIQMTPLVISGLLGMKEAAIRKTIWPTIAMVGIISLTSVCASEDTGIVSLRKINIIIGMVKRAPSSTAKKMPGLPCMMKKSIKSILAAPASIMEVVSPTRVAAP